MHTGDVGAVDDHGRFIFIDRVKVCSEIYLIYEYVLTIFNFSEHNKVVPGRVRRFGQDIKHLQ